MVVISLKSEEILLVGVLDELSFGSFFPHSQMSHLSSELSTRSPKLESNIESGRDWRGEGAPRMRGSRSIENEVDGRSSCDSDSNMLPSLLSGAERRGEVGVSSGWTIEDQHSC